MKTIYQQLQQHYQKLQVRLAKAQTKGRSQSFQARLLGRIQRCSMQMKHLGAGVAVIAALGWSAPVLGQIDTLPLNYIECTGVNNPFDTATLYQYPSVDIRSINFVDLDGDGDKDLLINNQEYSYVTNVYSTKLYYQENIGSPTTPVYGVRTINTAFDSVDVSKTIETITFVDVDVDGDEDMFVSGYSRLAGVTSATLNYHENVGTPSNPIFASKANSAPNPLQGAINYVNSIPFLMSRKPSIHADFVDLDGDGDKDCFITPTLNNRNGWPAANNDDKVIYYLNTGTATNPNYVQQPSSNNPLNNINLNYTGQGEVTDGLNFGDFNRQQDGTIDVAFFALNTGTPELVYYQNIGSAGNPNFANTNNVMLDSLFIKYGLPENGYAINQLTDLTNSGRVEIVAFDGVNTDIRYFKDTNTYTAIEKITNTSPLTIYPNPSTGVIQLERPLTGQLSIYNSLGQEVYHKVLEQTQALDLQQLEQGVYFLYIQTKEDGYHQTITITEK
ncbi:MAG: T9SS type A sorting domain-containing protein [Aureispira sp.]